jgi:hypothetical protein
MKVCEVRKWPAVDSTGLGIMSTEKPPERSMLQLAPYVKYMGFTKLEILASLFFFSTGV